jgi:DNA (cytosine-5)-methyltransferase 1
MSRPRLLDLFCGAGGAGMGYHRAGFDVVGIDLHPQPNYPFPFIQADATDPPVRLEAFDVIHASPPCQKHVAGMAAANKALGRTLDHVDLIPPTRALLRASGLPYIIENVEGAPLLAPVRLCATSFALPMYRHRLFESNVLLMGRECEHDRQTEAKYWTSWRPGGEVRRAKVVQVYGQAAERHLWPDAMGIDWMTYDEMAEAIPPAYTEWLGRQMLDALRESEAA